MIRQVLPIVVPAIVYSVAVDVQAQRAEESAPRIGVSPQATADPAIDVRPILENTNLRLTTAGTTLGRQVPQSETDPLEGHLLNCPVSNCCAGIMTQSLSMELVPGSGIACGTGGNTTPNAWARCFNPIQEGWANEAGAVTMTIESVDFGVEAAFPANPGPIPIFVNAYLDLNGCPASGFGTPNAPLIATVNIIIEPGQSGVLLSAVFPEPVVVELPAGAGLIVEYENLLDGTDPDNGIGLFGLWFGGNALGQCGSTYLRAVDCGLPDWLPDPEQWTHLALRVHVSGDCSDEGLDCPTDANADGHIGPLDLATLLAAWGPCNAGDQCECLDADGDGAIGPFDLATLLVSWGPCP